LECCRAGFSFPDLALEPDVYSSLDLDSDTNFYVVKPVFGIHVVARLKDSVSLAQARAEVISLFAQRTSHLPAWVGTMLHGQSMRVEPLQQYMTGKNSEPLLILFAVVGGLLLISCVNVATCNWRARYRGSMRSRCGTRLELRACG